MAGKLAELFVVIGAKADQFISTMDRVDSQVKAIGTKFSGLWKQITAGIGITWGLSQAVRQLTGFFGGSVKAAAENEVVLNDLLAAYESTGRVVGSNIKHLADFASGLQNVTLRTDEEIIGAQSLLAQMTKLDREGIKKATQSALGLSSVFKIDLQTSARAVGAAYEGNFTLLSRYIPAMKDAETKSEKMAIAEDWLANAFKRSRAETNTYAGMVIQLKKAYGEYREGLGEAITKNELVRDIIKDTTERIREQTPELQLNIAGWNLYWSAIKEGIDKTKDKKLPIFEILKKAPALLPLMDFADILKKINKISDDFVPRGETLINYAKEHGAEVLKEDAAIRSCADGITTFVRAADEVKKIGKIKLDIDYEFVENFLKSISSYEKTIEVIKKIKENKADYFDVVDTGLEIMGEEGLALSDLINQYVAYSDSLIMTEENMKKMAATSGLNLEGQAKLIKAWKENIRLSSDEMLRQRDVLIEWAATLDQGALGIIRFLKAKLIEMAITELWKSTMPFFAKLALSVPVVLAIKTVTDKISAYFEPKEPKKGYQWGGIAWHPQIAKIAERGPELVWPIYKPMPPQIIENVSKIFRTSSPINEEERGQRRGLRLRRPIDMHVGLYIERHLIRDTVIRIIEDEQRRGNLRLRVM